MPIAAGAVAYPRATKSLNELRSEEEFAAVPTAGDRFSRLAGTASQGCIYISVLLPLGCGARPVARAKDGGRVEKKQRPSRHSYRSDSVGCRLAARLAGR
jgi:hypothetical protein